MDILNDLENIFCNFLNDDSIKLTRETTAADIDGWDSLSHVGLVLEVESKYSVSFNTTEISTMRNVGDLVDLITTKNG